MATTTRSRATTGGPQQRRLSSRLLIGAALIVGIVVLYTNGAHYADGSAALPDAVTGQGDPRLVPSSLGSLDRAWVITGDEAARQIASLHIGAVRVVEAEVAGYGPDTTVWVATAPGAPAARRMLSAMVQAIDSGTTPFARPAPVPELPGAYGTSADGESHLFFASGDAVWWVASPPDDALEVARTLYTEVAR
jgi:hypothetical protein